MTDVDYWVLADFPTEANLIYALIILCFTLIHAIPGIEPKPDNSWMNDIL